MKKVDMVGQVIGELTVIRAGIKHKQDTRWVCKCSCGNEIECSRSNLLKGTPNSCGCKHGKVKHGAARRGQKTAMYKLWRGMQQRCNDAGQKGYKNYGGRGITVCEAWNDFANFYADMGDRPPKTSLDRIDNSKGYSKDNCAWVDYKTQAKNKRPRFKYPARDIKGRFTKEVRVYV